MKKDLIKAGFITVGMVMFFILIFPLLQKADAYSRKHFANIAEIARCPKWAFVLLFFFFCSWLRWRPFVTYGRLVSSVNQSKPLEHHSF